MNEVREKAREEMAKIPFLNSCMNMSTLFWGLGTALLVLGQFIIFANAICADLFSGLGFWIMWFGILLAFVKKEEHGLLIPFAVTSATYLVVFIILLVFRALSLSSIIHCACYAGLFFLAFRHSTVKRKMDNNKAQSMSNYQNIQGGYICPNCGAVMPQEANFCTVCGTKKTERRFCTGCGRPLMETDLFCPGCGMKQQK